MEGIWSVGSLSLILVWTFAGGEPGLGGASGSRQAVNPCHDTLSRQVECHCRKPLSVSVEELRECVIALPRIPRLLVHLNKDLRSGGLPRTIAGGWLLIPADNLKLAVSH